MKPIELPNDQVNATFRAQQARIRKPIARVDWTVKREALICSGLVEQRARERGPLILRDFSAERDRALLMTDSSIAHRIVYEPADDLLCGVGEPTHV